MDEQNDKTLPNSLPPSYATLHEKAFHGDVTEAEKQGITSSDATFKRTSAVIAKRVEEERRGSSTRQRSIVFQSEIYHSAHIGSSKRHRGKKQ